METAQEWETCKDPLRMLDTIQDRAQPGQLRRFAIVCCQPLLGALNHVGLKALAVADRLSRGEATEVERTAAECAAFRFVEYLQDADQYYYNEDYVAAGHAPYQTDPRFAAAEAAAASLSSDPRVAARLAARSALEATVSDGRAVEQARLCRELRAIFGNPFAVDG